MPIRSVCGREHDALAPARAVLSSRRSRGAGRRDYRTRLSDIAKHAKQIIVKEQAEIREMETLLAD
jgi:hypothetical protein